MSGDTKSDEQKTERFNMFMSPSEMKAIDEWAWKNRVRSKSEAVRRLVQIGLRLERGVPHLLAKTDAVTSQLRDLPSLIDGKSLDTMDEMEKTQLLSELLSMTVGALYQQLRFEDFLFDLVDEVTPFTISGAEQSLDAALERARRTRDKAASGESVLKKALDDWENTQARNKKE